MKVPTPPMRRIRFRLDVCFTSRGELVGGELQCNDSSKKKPQCLGGWSGGTSRTVLLLDDLLRQIKIEITEAMLP